jgi:hypothetical protein
MKRILLAVWILSAFRPCLADEELTLSVPNTAAPVQLSVPLPKDANLDAASQWQLVERDTPENKIAAQLVHAMADDGTVADLGAWIMAVIPPRKGAPAARQFTLQPLSQSVAAHPAFVFQDVDEKSIKLVDGQSPVFVYNYGAITDENVPAGDNRRTRACYLHPVWGLQGEIMTDDFPKDHYHHHGIFWSWPHVGIGDKQYDLWKYTDIKQQFVRWICRQTGPAGAVLAVENGWFVDGKKVMIERCWLRTFLADAESRSLDFDFVFIPVDKPITLRGAEGKSYGGLNMRFDVKDEKKTLITTPGGTAAKDLTETPLPWCDLTYPFTSPSTPSGAAMFVAPDDPDFPQTWMARHYGILSIGWPGIKGKTFPAGEPIRLSYRIWIHKSAVTVEELDKAFEAYGLKSKVGWKK